MHDGRVAQVGTPTEIYESPRTAFVSDFIGVSNFLEGHVQAIQDDKPLVAMAKGLQLRVCPLAGREVRPGDRLCLAVRPEKIHLTSSPVAEDGNTCVGTIEHIVYLGTVTHYYVRSEADESLIVYLQNHQQASRTSEPWRVRDTVHLSWKPEHTLIVEKNSEDGPSIA